MGIKVDIHKHLPTFDLDVRFEAGDECLGLFGPSGAGKSFTLRSIAGIETPDRGRIEVDGRVFFDSQQGINLKARERKCALLFQDYMLFPNLTVADNICAGLPRQVGKEQRHQIVKEQLERFDLAGFGRRYPASLSGGQRQRVAVARMLAAAPPILMLDEPFSALDSDLKISLATDLQRHFHEFDGTILYVSHDVEEVLLYCDDVAIIKDGKVCQFGLGRDILKVPPRLSELRL
ncbi:MAG: ATP-binding cassette domain-containing protein [Coriobacteriales bacterium]|jgi:molybdate transport system ATP-binding protein|nr:ATP-binding cassette domain-containing protein [Coriobacteriales bacterium]